MDKQTAVRKILRSLCSNKPDEDLLAIDNYRRTQLAIFEFQGVEYKLLEIIRPFYISNSGPPSIESLVQRAKMDVDNALRIYIDEVGHESPVYGANYRAVLSIYTELNGIDLIESALVNTSQILKEGKQEKTPKKIEVMKGTKASIDYMMQQLTTVRRKMNPHQAPMSQVDACDFLRKEYARKQKDPTASYGYTTAIGPIDEATRGGQAKELWVLAGFTGHGKTTLALNWARHLAVDGPFNVLYYSLEMPKEQVWRILACSHSCNPKFNRKPLNYQEMKSGILAPADASFYLDTVLPDVKMGQGHLEVVNQRGLTSIEDVWGEAEVFNQQYPLDVLFIDYDTILAPPKGVRTQNKGDRINENIIRAKQLASEFDGGYGVLVVMLHQTNRKGVEEAAKTNGVYTVNAIADSNEVERNADQLFAIYQDIPLQQKCEGVITHLKSRDSKIIPPFNVYFPGEHRFIGELAQIDPSQLDDLLDV